MKKITIALLTFLLLFVGISSSSEIQADAASYPLIFMDSMDSDQKIIKDYVGLLKFTIFHEYKNERYNIEIYDENGNLRATASDDMYCSTYFRTVTISVDTKDLDLDVGKYTVVYWMDFYTFSEWHSAPRKYESSFSVIENICNGKHKFVYTGEIDEATCDEPGMDAYHCEKCGVLERRTTPTAHTFDEDSADFTCNECGYVENGPVLRKVNGVWRYYKNGVLNKSNTLVKHNGKWYHVNGGKWVKDTTLVKYGSKWHYVKNGVKCYDDTLVKYNNKWHHVKGGVWVKDTTITKYGKTWYYVKNGIKNNAADTLAKYNGKWYHVENGKWVKDTTLVKFNGEWYYVENGVLSTKNTLVKFNGKWYHVNGGKWVKDTTIVNYNGKRYYVKGGVWVKANGNVKIGSKNYVLKSGVVIR